jgi:Zn-dependent protease with chaperone function
MLRTSFLFVLLISGTWLLELVVGGKVVTWFWGTDWQFWDGQPSLAVFFASLTNGRIQSGSIVLFWLWMFFILHIVRVVYSLYGPFLERWKLGARRPSRREQERFNTVYLSLTREVGRIRKPRCWRVADGLGIQAYWIGYVLVIDRELLHHRYFVPILAHHLGHVKSEERIARRLYAMLPPPLTFAGLFVGLPFAIGLLVLYPVWMWYWRERVYAADRYVVELGQGHALLVVLKELYLKLDQVTKGGRMLKPFPYVEQRIDRIEQFLGVERN